MKLERTKLPEHNLDMLRAIAVLLVLTDHTIESLHSHAMPVLWLGQAGVQAFFVHTSLVLMSSLERDGAPGKPGWLKRFYIRRAMRIYPLVWATVALVLIFSIPRGLIPAVFEAPSLATIVTNVALVQDLAGLPDLQVVMWSLPIEVQMYLVLPLLYFIARSRRSWPMVAVLLSALITLAFFRWANSPAHPFPGIWRLPVLQFAPSFCLGVLAYHLLRRRTNEGVYPAKVWVPLIALAVIVTTPLATGPGAFWLPRIIFCAILALAIPLVRDSAPSRVTRLARTVAVYSYGIYLLHMSALRFGFSYLKGQPFVLQCFAAVAALVVGCYVAYHFVEKPGIALGKWLLGERRNQFSLEATAPAP